MAVRSGREGSSNLHDNTVVTRREMRSKGKAGDDDGEKGADPCSCRGSWRCARAGREEEGRNLAREAGAGGQRRIRSDAERADGFSNVGQRKRNDVIKLLVEATRLTRRRSDRTDPRRDDGNSSIGAEQALMYAEVKMKSSTMAGLVRSVNSDRASMGEKKVEE